MSVTTILTAQDAIEYGIQLVSAHSASVNQEGYKWALHLAYTELGQQFDWSFLYSHGRVPLQAAQTTGTVTYDHAGGSSERLLTLAGATLPSWAEGSAIRMNNVTSVIDKVLSTTTAQLDSVLNPGVDVAAGATYRMYPWYYLLPEDFRQLVTPRAEYMGWTLTPLSYDNLMMMDRDNNEHGTPQWFCVRGALRHPGRMGLFVYPPSDETKSLDFIYERIPREVRYTGVYIADVPGSIAISLSTPTAVVGTGTAFSSAMVGSILRVGNRKLPTGFRGESPYLQQHVIALVADTTHLTLKTDATAAVTGASYSISDPIDIDPTLHPVLLAGFARRLAMEREFKDAVLFERAYQEALSAAKASDNRTDARQIAGFRLPDPSFRRLAKSYIEV
jgi:hypothetical protein